MGNKKSTNPDFLNGIPELLVLQLLDRKPMYGYELVREIKLVSQEQFDFGEGCIYPILHRLEHEGLLLGSTEKVNSRTRVVYRVTPAGQKRLAQSIDTWKTISNTIAMILQGGKHVEPGLA